MTLAKTETRDLCSPCKSKGDIETCKETICYYHSTWIVGHKNLEIEFLKAKVRELERNAALQSGDILRMNQSD